MPLAFPTSSALFVTEEKREMKTRIKKAAVNEKKTHGTKSLSLWVLAKPTLFNREQLFRWASIAMCSPLGLRGEYFICLISPANTRQNHKPNLALTNSCKKSKAWRSTRKLSGFTEYQQTEFNNIPKWEEGTFTLSEELNSLYLSLYFLRLYPLLSWRFSFGTFFLQIC